MNAPAAKPAHGEPCNNCLLCCLDSLCILGEHLFRRSHGPCPAVRTHGCGCVIDPDAYAAIPSRLFGPGALSEAASVLIGKGIGCDAQYEDEPRSQPFVRKMEDYRRTHAARIGLAMRLWGMA